MNRYALGSLVLVPLSLSWLCACGDDGTGPVPDARTTPDASTVDAPPPPPPDAMPPQPDAPPPDTHLLITEVALQDTAHEFVEIYNPGTQTVSLANYYLSDDAEYWRLPAIFSQIDPATQPWPSINLANDFIGKFPDNASIGPGQVMTIATRYDGFMTSYGMAPDFAFLNAPGPDVAMLDPGLATGVPTVGTDPQLTNSGEAVVLFYWDGASDLVKDVDLLNAGGPAMTAANRLESKDGQSLDGPDADTDMSAYAPETPTANIKQMDMAAGIDLSHKRIMLEAGNETQDGTGNGMLGDDEMSEDVAVTWDDSTTFNAPTPGQVPASLTP